MKNESDHAKRVISYFDKLREKDSQLKVMTKVLEIIEARIVAADALDATKV